MATRTRGAGRLRHEITLRKPTKVRDNKGGLDTSFANVTGGAVRAEILSLDGREATIDHVLEGVSVYRITIRWRDDVRADWQVRYGALDLAISAPPADEDGRRKWLVIMATSRGAAKAA